MSMMVCILGSNKEERAPEAEDGVNETKEEVAYKSSKALVLCVSSARRDCRPDRQTKNSFTIVSFLNNREDSIFFTTFQ